MKIVGNLKKKVNNAETKEEAKELIKKAGMLLDDHELEMVTGGVYLDDKYLNAKYGPNGESLSQHDNSGQLASALKPRKPDNKRGGIDV